MIREDFVNLEVAKKLHEKGFDWPCLSTIGIDGKISWGYCRKQNVTDLSRIKGKYLEYLAPSLYDAQKWLRIRHNIHIVIDNSACGYGWFLYKADNGTRIADYADNGPNDGGCWDTYEEALNEGILEGLKRI